MENIGEDEPQPIQSLPEEWAKVNEGVVEEQQEMGCFNSTVFEGPAVESGEDFVTRSPDWSPSSIGTSNIGESLNSTTPTTTNKRTLLILKPNLEVSQASDKSRIEDEMDVPHPIPTLPEEVRGKIFNYLPQNNVPTLQLVCKIWNNDVNNHYNYEIKLDERSPFFKQILQLRIKKLEIIQLIQHQITCPCYPDLMGVIVRHPNIIEELDLIFDSATLDEVISAPNLQKLLQNSQESLKRLKICLTPKILNHPFPPNIKYNFKNLSFLNIYVKNFSTIKSDIWNNGLLSQIANSKMPNLHHTYIHIHIIADYKVQDSIPIDFPIVNLLTKNPNGLETISINLHDRSNRLTTKGINLGPKDVAVFKKILSVKYLSLCFVESGLQDLDVGSVLISNQTNLKCLDTGFEFIFPIDLFQSMLSKNYKTIQIVSVNQLDVKIGEPFDLSIFENCSNLRWLELTMSENESRQNLEDNFQDLINLTHLPCSIKMLDLKDFCIMSHEILSLLNSDFVNGLENLKLINCGSDGEFGLNSEIVEKILTLEHTKLHTITLKKFNVSDDLEEEERLNQLFIRLGHPDGFDSLARFYLKFSRDANNHFVTELI